MQVCRTAIQNLLRRRCHSIYLIRRTPVPLLRQGKMKLLSGTALLSLGWFSQSSSKGPNDNQGKITNADLLYKENKFREVYELLKDEKDSDDVEILWRLSRVEYNIAQEQATSPEEKKRLVLEAYDIITRALALDDSHYATHKWMSILLDAKGYYEGTKSRISNLNTTKLHLVRASELNPNDATTLYMIGLWCFEVADLPWYQRQIASAVFAKPPDSSYEEALDYFLKAEEVDPNFYSQNLLMLGKTFMRLNNEEKARYYLNLAASYPVSTDDDLMAKNKAEELLKKLKPQKV